MPKWIADYNRSELNAAHIIKRWTPLLQYDSYRNTQVSVIEGLQSRKNKRIELIQASESATRSSIDPHDPYEQMCFTPAGNSAVLAFAKQVITRREMGQDEVPDMLNIVLDAPRMISGRFGPESVEYEDMLYRLDRDIEDFIAFTTAQLSSPEEMVIVLTAAHGTSPSYNATKEPQSRFNVMQAEVIVNAYLGSQYGNAEWVLGYENRNIYLNHNLIKEKKLSIPALQHEVATFCMQLKGVSHALAADALRNSYFGSGYGRKIQNGFYPRRSGDVIVNLMPDWIEECGSKRSLSGSMYLYDRQVPLIIFGGGVKPAQSHDNIDLTAVAPTVAYILGITPPSAAEGEKLNITKR